MEKCSQFAAENAKFMMNFEVTVIATQAHQVLSSSMQVKCSLLHVARSVVSMLGTGVSCAETAEQLCAL